jgi:hypothetical protein
MMFDGCDELLMMTKYDNLLLFCVGTGSFDVRACNTMIDICSNWILSVRVKVNNDCRGQIDVSTTRSTHNQTHNSL